MKKNLIKITAAAFAATMAFGTTGLMAYADEDGAAVETPIVIERSPETPAEEAPIAEAPTEAPAETPAEEPTLTEVPYTGEPTEETPTEAVEAPTEEIIVTTVTTEVAVTETQTTTATEETAQVTTTAAQGQQLLTSGSWRSNKGDYIFDASRPSGVITSNGSQTNFTYDVSGSSVTINYGSTSVTGTFSVSSADNFTISWNDGSVETFTRQASSTTTTTAKTSSSSTSTTKSSSSSKSSSSAPAGKTDSPKTGDDFHALPIAAFALTGAAVCFISFRKREND